MAFDPLIFTEDYLRVRAVPTCHTSTFVWCHGKGQKGDSWQFMVEPLRKFGHCNHIAFIFPYLEYRESNDASSVSKNQALVQKIVHEEIEKGCDPGRIAVGGYNEGLDVALLSTLSGTNTIGGVLGITDRFVVAEAVRELRKPANSMTPVSVVDRSGAEDDTGAKVLASFHQPVGAFLSGSKNAAAGAEPVTQEELEGLDSFIHKVLPVEIVARN
ncbi:hypothetical protein LTR10_020233 [Elasticomyces elasticus]|uniref:Acyl-protein thioesterase 1 n=1 Tax=Exophiala sideris TaxID=1016849 RepID=A0ABR0JRR5_9EURO|nr:hypothetical protein LTR10_020233 [Elasticomyces elasticus]KAK5040295.1 hypothetical protein LTS07_000793 [Exophiala sideris]KAK5043279.1 hypothetical protein LTR13_001050 [Exophiala sideris]KAK5068673.1 hypothetical protein LTR69_000794 [Exophiala sideris]KAK5186271.1 hypothetical protein LTR44_001327 [Eurotiomycetes sp. CCFEE 6388]